MILPSCDFNYLFLYIQVYHKLGMNCVTHYLVIIHLFYSNFHKDFTKMQLGTS